MIFNIGLKYIILLGLLVIGLLAGGFILFGRQRSFGSAAARITRDFDRGGWMEIKPRVNPAAGEILLEGRESAAGALKKNVKEGTPVINWCSPDSKVRGTNEKIIINEVSWMGSFQSYSDEWIELKNITAGDIDLGGGQIQNKSQKIKISFDRGEIIPANGFYLLERTNDDSVPGIGADKIYTGSLGNSNESLYLFSADCAVQDSITAAAKWPAGDNKTKQTMARAKNLLWQTSRIPGGTPKAENWSL